MKLDLHNEFIDEPNDQERCDANLNNVAQLSNGYLMHDYLLQVARVVIA